MVSIQKFAKGLTVTDDEDKPDYFYYYERKIPYYDFLTNIVLYPEAATSKFLRLKDLPDHPANPEHEDHEEGVIY